MIELTSRRKTLFAAAFLFLAPALIIGKGSETRLRTRLTGGAIAGLTPSGHADFRAIPADGRARLNVEVEDVNLAAGTEVGVFVDGAQVGSITISAAPVRGGELELNSQDGQAVPDVKAGALVVVRNGATAILSGVLN
jgi:hypothetical protein